MRHHPHVLVVTVLALTVLYYLPLPAAAGAVVAGMRFALFILYTVFVTGLILQKFLATGKRDAFTLAAGSLAYGLGAVLVCLFITTLAGLSAATTRHLLPIWVIGVFLIDRVLVARRKTPHTSQTPTDAEGQGLPTGDQEAGGPARRWMWHTALGAILLLVIALLLLSGIPTDHTKDTLDHIAYVNEIDETGEPFPATAFYAEGGENGRDIRKGLMHYFYGLARIFVGSRTLLLLTLFNVLFALVLLLSVYTVALEWFGDVRVAVLSTVFMLIGLAGGLSGGAFRVSFYPNRLGIAFLLFFLLHATRYIRSPNRRDLAGASLSAFAAAATHIFFFIAVFAAGVVIKIGKGCFPGRSTREHLSRVVRLGVVVGGAMAPYILFRYITASPQANDLHREIQGVVFLTDSLYVADPFAIWNWFGPIGLAAFLILPQAWSQRDRSLGLGYAIASLLAVPLVLFNPVLLPVLHHIMTYLVLRLNVIAPFYLLPAWYIVRYTSGIGSGERRGIWQHMLAGLCALAVIASLASENGFGGAFVSEEQRNESYVLWQDGIDALAAETGPAVIASDPVTSYTLTAFTPHYVVCTLDQHAPPNDLRIEERIVAARDIISPFVPLTEVIPILERHGVSYIVLNGRQSERTQPHYWGVDAEIVRAARAKFDHKPDIFVPVYDRDNFIVYYWNGRPATAGDTIAVPYRLPAVPEGFTADALDAGIARLVAYRIGRSETPAGGLAGSEASDGTRVSRGGRLAIDFVWTGTPPYPLANYVVSVRLDHVDPGLPFQGKPFPKIARKAKEALIRRRYRFRSEHKVAKGLLGPEVWRGGDLILDRASVPIPLDLVPGEYKLAVKMLPVTNQPNYRWRDLLYDDDVYQGPVIYRLHVE